MLTFPVRLLDRLCPMHVCIDAAGQVTRLGPTIAKVVAAPGAGTGSVFDMFEVTRPSGIDGIAALVDSTARRLRLRLRHSPHTPLVGHFVADGTGGGVLDLSFGVGVAAALGAHPVSSADFPPTDLSVEMLFLIESRSAAMSSALRLNRRLHVARLAAEEQAQTDMLTGLCNRRALERELDRLAGRGAPFAVMLIDLDCFKAVNDGHGHAAGDRMLRMVSDVLRGNIRRGDVAARPGGDEFVLLLPEPPSQDALRGLAERLIAEIEAPVASDDGPLRISASIGIACHPGGAIEGPERVLDCADAALYKAKAAGRGRAIVSAPHRSDRRSG
ncbi:Diguanylate cyclase DosC [Roseivivax jejudonensis]|uniref:diguanylate cyclase n=1 Tax=Roseivivax jejudonensis TaxID=1529041 RepID=A0A1X6Y825_9RHOB|nr:GGDEF domain-containing protein [Roseivivax jejudonensis]SLN13522.1 Diguanylate cyclase DosC [Roseivivax jejudonensis]